MTTLQNHWEIEFSVRIGKQIIMRKWRAVKTLFKEWIPEEGKVAAFERISYGLINKVDKWIINQKCFPFLNYKLSDFIKCPAHRVHTY